MALVKGLREDTPCLKSITKRPPKMMEEIQERSHDYLQQEEGQTAVKTDRNKKDNPGESSGKKEDEGIKSPTGRTIIPSAGDKNSYCKYHKQNGHDTEECRDLLEFVEQGLKKGKFREYTNRYKQRDDDRRVRKRVNSPESKADRKKDEPKDRGTHREIAMISGGILEEGNPLLRKRQKEVGTNA
ncbi:hypothetical protein PIB30_096283 [Stylosanthes scabra]|uniref:Reverse transcriptase domain-containing protein n=1 Tax=Stylosanthes scabra TaxID=79078 RepID=A0ABU6SWA7_9FABA|nr:hypothetical protein [Stylosanthes scabra]